MSKIDLVQAIRDNPGCVAIVDNDSWTLFKQNPDRNPHRAGDWDKSEAWEDENTIASDGQVLPLGDGGYGGDLLRALAVIVGVKIESV